ncbi:hypothetical protein niasHS_011635 [Heterodera schachtii]|uniref:RING-type domain-containing protein n=1 Tax=Heterodera schachtii TaxID=97005 RepID=A0ABD2IFG1_HETSC
MSFVVRGADRFCTFAQPQLSLSFFPSILRPKPTKCKCGFNSAAKCDYTPPHPQEIQFTIHEFQVRRNGVWAELECTICLGEIEKETPVKLLAILEPCKHIFHNECIFEWLKNHKTCPICRANAKISVPSLNEVIIDVPSADGQNEGNNVGTGTDEVQVNQCNNGTANGPN